MGGAQGLALSEHSADAAVVIVAVICRGALFPTGL